MNEELNQIAQTIDRIVAKAAEADPGKGCQERHNDAVLELLSEAGIRRVAVSAAAGGLEGDLAYLTAVLKRLGYHAVNVALLEDHLAAELIANYQVDVPNGMMTVSSRSNLSLVGVGDNAVARGSCRNVPWGSTATHVVAIAQCDGDECLVLLPIAQASAITRQNIAGEARDNLTFNGVAPLAWIEDSEAVRDFRSRLFFYRSVAMLGAGEHALDLTITHVTDRSQFGSPLLKKQVVQHYIAEMYGALTAVRAACEATVSTFAGGDGTTSLAAALATRIEADRMASTVARLSHQLHGAIGFTKEHQLHRFTTRLTAWRQDDLSETGCALELARLVPEFGGPWNMMTARGSA